MPTKVKRRRRHDPFSWERIWEMRDGMPSFATVLDIMMGNECALYKTIEEVEQAWMSNRDRWLAEFPNPPGERHGAQWKFEILPTHGPRPLVCTNPTAQHFNYSQETPGGFPQQCWESSISYLDRNGLLSDAERVALGDAVEEAQAPIECRRATP